MHTKRISNMSVLSRYICDLLEFLFFSPKLLAYSDRFLSDHAPKQSFSDWETAHLSSVSVVSMQVLDGRNEFLWCTLQWEAEPKDWTIDGIGLRLKIKKEEFRVYDAYSKNNLKVKIWSKQCRLRRKPSQFSGRHFSGILGIQQRKTPGSNMKTILI